VPVREALSTKPSMNRLPKNAATLRLTRPVSSIHTKANAAHNNKLLK
jgi:hypothetical protein